MILIQAICSLEPTTNNMMTIDNNEQYDDDIASTITPPPFTSLLKLLLVILTNCDLENAMLFFQDELMTIKLERLVKEYETSKDNNLVQMIQYCRQILAVCG